ncbi:hypothetical protein N7471_005413 [Penicillium samsonianum]|uniref:uncharacterized protein n=1 Tax=Penicillium samsonianum TaxID=1882272 RepID=UPI002548A11B|nr:uncharacterized protein N7471_005413 [Penicillium samsonianum]KAJ6138927.1 hypothetical protein N7471_005413 [Penicillium samsonianum]
MSHNTKGVVKNALPEYPSKYLPKHPYDTVLRLTSSSPRTWRRLFHLLQSVTVLIVEPTIHDDAEATEAEAKRNQTLRAQLRVLEQQLCGTEARSRDSVGRLPISKFCTGLAVVSKPQSQEKTGNIDPELGSH